MTASFDTVVHRLDMGRGSATRRTAKLPTGCQQQNKRRGGQPHEEAGPQGQRPLAVVEPVQDPHDQLEQRPGDAPGPISDRVLVVSAVANLYLHDTPPLCGAVLGPSGYRMRRTRQAAKGQSDRNCHRSARLTADVDVPVHDTLTLTPRPRSKFCAGRGRGTKREPSGGASALNGNGVAVAGLILGYIGAARFGLLVLPLHRRHRSRLVAVLHAGAPRRLAGVEPTVAGLPALEEPSPVPA